MSRSAEAWFYAECEVRGGVGWVIVVLCYHAGDDGYVSRSKRTLAEECRISETSVHRAIAIAASLGVLEEADTEADAPAWWLAYPANRRPKLYRLTAYQGSRFATPDGARARMKESLEIRDKRRAAKEQVRGGAMTPLRHPYGTPDTPETTPLRHPSAERHPSREPDPDCVSCHGRGTVYNATGGHDTYCPCTWDPDYAPRPAHATRPPAGFGMPAEREQAS